MGISKKQSNMSIQILVANVTSPVMMASNNRESCSKKRRRAGVVHHPLFRTVSHSVR